VDTLRELATHDRVINATAIFMEPDQGLRTFCSPSEIAYFEYTNILASEGLKRMLFGLHEGLTDHDLAKLAEYNGEPQGCHMTLKCSGNRIGLASPMGARIERGGPLSTNICYWGSNSCRAGWVADGPRDLPVEARDYVAEFAGPYFEAIGEWFGMLRIGTPGRELDDVIRRRLPFEKFGIFLNAGHLIHLDEWVSSPVYPGSEVKIHSGMAIQVDVIPSSKTFFTTRVEDGVVIADAALRTRLAAEYPGLMTRCAARRKFMIEALGIAVPEDVLPLSNIPGIVPPYFLAPRQVLTLS
jgi:Xaa-Pro aminopeptidase